ncbi:MAG: thiamine phosphate synthase [Pseudomonadota bacterium]
MSLHAFYPIFDSAEWCERLVPLGIKLVQLRAKDLSEAQLRDELRRAKQICDAHNCTLVVNDYWQLAIELGCDWVHLGQEDLDDADLGAIRRADIKLGLSTHDHAELYRALACEPDYVALGPVYPTILKKMKWTEQGLDRVTEWKARVGDLPLVGIGGLNVDRAPGVLKAGADIVSVVTDITLNSDPEARVLEWLNVVENHTKQ